MIEQSGNTRLPFGAAASSLSRRELLRRGAGLTFGLSGAAAIGGSLPPEEAFAAGLVNIEVDAGQNENPFRWNADAMKSKFGADIKMIGLPFVGQYEKLVSELTARSAAYDLLVFPPYFLETSWRSDSSRSSIHTSSFSTPRSATTTSPSIATPSSSATARPMR